MVYHPFRHLGLKFLSVAVALGLWFTVAGEQTVERSLKVPLERTGWPAQLELVEAPPDVVDVRVRGASGILSTLSAGDVIATLDLSRVTEGPELVYLTPDSVRARFGVEVMDVSPPSVQLRFEKSVTKRVPVNPVVEGEPAPGYVAGDAVVEPTTVEVTGPETAMQRFKEATTKPVSVSGRRSQVRESVSIWVSDPSLRPTTRVEATVTVPIQPRPIERRITQVPVRARNAGRGRAAQIVPAVVTVTARGPKDVVDGLTADTVSVFVDLAGLSPGRWYNLSVQVESPHDLVTVRTEPAAVQVRIK